MSKKIVIAVFFLFALVICYGVEQRVYQTNTYSFYKNMQMELPEIADADSNNVLEQEVYEENQNAK